MRTTFIAALLPNATAKVQKNLHICKKISLTGLDSLDLCPQGKDAISPALKTKLNAEGSEVSQIMGQLKLPAPDELPLASKEE